jgi:hypothetical protein
VFEAASKKLERAAYFLSRLEALVNGAGGFAYIKREKQQELRANLDGFFFEIISAKDMFLQGINDKCNLGLERDEATNIAALKRCLKCKGELKALNAVVSIERNLHKKNTWLWILNNYRNSSTHRDLLPIGHEAKIECVIQDKQLFDKMKQGKIRLGLIGDRQDIKIPSNVPKVTIPPENVKSYLFKDPEDSSKGNMSLEVIPYCKQSLEKMSEFLGKLYSELND